MALTLNSLSVSNQDIIFVQETYLENVDQIKAVKTQWDGHSEWAHGHFVHTIPNEWEFFFLKD
jgi:hypothetical protein